MESRLMLQSTREQTVLALRCVVVCMLTTAFPGPSLSVCSRMLCRIRLALRDERKLSVKHSHKAAHQHKVGMKHDVDIPVICGPLTAAVGPLSGLDAHMLDDVVAHCRLDVRHGIASHDLGQCFVRRSEVDERNNQAH